MASNFFDLDNVAFEDSNGNIVLKKGTIVPTDGTAGYITGALFMHTDGGSDTAIYVNEGSKTSCNFDAISTSIFAEAVTFTSGAQALAVARTATVTGATTGTIAAGTSYVTVTAGADVNSIIILPAPIVGNIIWLYIGATGYELRTSAPATIAINGGSGANAESAIGVGVLARVVCTSATTWIGATWSSIGAFTAMEAAA